MLTFAYVYERFDMRKELVIVFWSLLTLTFFISNGCSNKKPMSTDSILTDSTKLDTTSLDTIENVIAETPMPKAADELFDDFIFNFAANRKLQRKRITFPLPVFRDNKMTKKIEEANWKIDHFFMPQEYYTLILDNQKQQKLVKDTTVKHVVIERIYLNKQTVEAFLFDRLNGEWKLTSIHYQNIMQNKNADFLKFYKQFSEDPDFQIASMAEEVEFSAPDPNDDFGNITGIMMPQQWPDFKPELIPSNVIYNILYSPQSVKSNRKIFVIRGIANGFEMEMDFKKKGNHWKLTRFNG